MDFIKKILNALKSILEWLVAIALIVSGYLLFRYVKDRFFGPTTVEKSLLAEIEKNEEKLAELEREVQGKVEKDAELQEEQEKIQEKIDKLKEEYYAKQEEFAQREWEATDSTHEENLDYINKKYCKG